MGDMLKPPIDQVAIMWAAHVLNEFDRTNEYHSLLRNAVLITECESPAERALLWGLTVSVPTDLRAQWPVTANGHNYRLDFAVPDKKIAIEIDGHKFHSSKASRTTDAKRDRDLQIAGWRVFRFTGSEIYKSPEVAAGELLRICELPALIPLKRPPSRSVFDF